jgi:hypothetical protein
MRLALRSSSAKNCAVICGERRSGTGLVAKVTVDDVPEELVVTRPVLLGQALLELLSLKIDDPTELLGTL